MALASILMGAAFLVLVCYELFIPFLFGLAGVALGIMALYHIAMHKKRLRGKPYAIAGILTCCVEVLATVAFLHSRTYAMPKEDYDQLVNKAEIALYNERGLSLSKVAKPYDALQAHKQARKMAQKEAALACYGIGSSLMDLQEYDKALAAFDEAIEHHPRPRDVYQKKAVTYQRMGRFQDSIDACKVTIHSFPDFAKAYCSMGQAYESLGNDREAINLQIEAVRRDPQWPLPQQIINALLTRIGDEQYCNVVHQRLSQITDPSASLHQREEFKAIALPLSRAVTRMVGCDENNQDLPDEAERALEQTLVIQVKLLEEFIDGNPQSMWTDDGKYILSALYIELPHEQAKWLRDLLINHPYVHIEQWTKDHFSSVLCSNAYFAIRARLLAYYKDFGPKEQLDASCKQFIKYFPGIEEVYGDQLNKLIDELPRLNNCDSILSKSNPQIPLEQGQPGSTDTAKRETL